MSEFVIINKLNGNVDLLKIKFYNKTFFVLNSPLP